MIKAGDVIENPVTGEVLEFLRTSADTDGELTEFICTVRVGGFVAGKHIHPHQDELFEILSGTMTVRAGRETLTLEAGESILVEAGTPHRFWNRGEEDLRFRVEVRPSLEFERFIATMYGLAQDGKTSRKGMPNPLRMAVIANAHFDDVRLPHVPAWLQRCAIAPGAAVGRLARYRPVYDAAHPDMVLATNA
jgi:mannose-6-phosphate isomerase-like protein (cupin superfamily)